MDTREEVSITYGKANPKTYWHCKACDVSITYGKANRKKCLNTVGGRMFQLPTVKRTIEMTLMDFLKKGSKDGQSIPARIILYAEKRREEMMIATEANCPVANGKYS